MMRIGIMLGLTAILAGHAGAELTLLPQVTHLPDAAREGIEKLRAAGVHVVTIGAVPTHNDCNQTRDIQNLETLAKPPPARTAIHLDRGTACLQSDRSDHRSHTWRHHHCRTDGALAHQGTRQIVATKCYA